VKGEGKLTLAPGWLGEREGGTDARMDGGRERERERERERGRGRENRMRKEGQDGEEGGEVSCQRECMRIR